MEDLKKAKTYKMHFQNNSFNIRKRSFQSIFY